MRVDGECLAPHYRHGEVLVFDQEAQPKAGDFVVLYVPMKDAKTGETVIRGWVKRMVLNVMWPIGKLPHVPHPQSDVLPVVIVEALNPPRQWSVRLTDVYGMHKCIGSQAELGIVVEGAIPGKQARKAPRAARGMSAKTAAVVKAQRHG